MAQQKRDLPLPLSTLAATILLVVAILTVGACGSGEPTTTSSTSAPGTTTDQGVVTEDALLEMPEEEFQLVVADASVGLVEHLEGGEAAFYATLLALDRGYDIPQLLAGSLADRVDAEGRITSADGSLLAPTRAPEGTIEPLPSDAAAESTALHPSAPVALVALRSSSPLLVADSSTDPGERTVALTGASGRLQDMFELAKEMIEDRKDDWEQALEGRERPQEAADEQAELEEKWSTMLVYGTMRLGARGYSAQQILEGILLDNVRVEQVWQDSERIQCWYVVTKSNAIIRPDNPPAIKSNCPDASKDAPTHPPPEEVRAAAAGIAGDQTAQGSETADGDSATEDGSEPSTATEPDIDGIKNGLYTGEVSILTLPEHLPFEILESTVELEVTDEGIAATVEYVQRFAGRYDLETGETTCIATIRMLYFGEGPVTDPLSLILEPVDQEIIAFEGQCGVNEQYSHGYEDVLLGLFAEQRPRTLAGSFSGGPFEGNMGVHGVSAAIAE